MTAGSILATLGALAGVLILIWGIQALARLRTRTSGAGRRLQLTESIALDAKRRLHLVRCDDRWLLLQTGGTHDIMVGWLPGEPP